MDQRRPNKRPSKLDTQGIRGLVFALAVSSTIGFWAIISRFDGAQSAGADVPAQISGEPPMVQEENQVVVNLPPIPTLVPALNTSNQVAVGLPTPQTINLASDNPPAITLPGSVGDPVHKERSQQAPKQKKPRGGQKTTSTRSSK